MKFQVGDEVKLVKTRENGKILKILSHDLYEVLVDDIEIPVHGDDLEYPYLDWFVNDRRKNNEGVTKVYQARKEPDFIAKKIDKGYYISFWVEYKWDGIEDILDTIKIYFTNETNNELNLFYNYYSETNSGIEFQTTVNVFESIYLHTINFDEINDKPDFFVRYKTKTMKDWVVPFIKLKPKKLFDELSKLALINAPAYYFQILGEEQIELNYINEKEVVKPQKTKSIHQLKDIKKELILPQIDIDLHIEKLLPKGKKILPSAILEFQMTKFEEAFSRAKITNQDRLYVIHGIGEGILKKHIHDFLKNEEDVKSYNNNYHPKYGYGATEIVFII